jgi:hypothetical protein
MLVLEIYVGITSCSHINNFRCFVHECLHFGDCVERADGSLVRCKWWFLDNIEKFKNATGHTSITWEDYCKSVAAQQIPDEWLPHPYYANQGLWMQYWQAIFWAVEATTGVGASVAPIRIDEIIMTTVVGMFGLLISALIIGSAGSALYNMDFVGAAKRSNLESINAYLTKRKVPIFFQKIIADYYGHENSVFFVHDVNSYVRQLCFYLLVLSYSQITSGPCRLAKTIKF